ncbi:low-density lipoprotein receptor-related protein 6-like [Trichogramma pretiosum]|uniref:low-density lipoprotein receptor-related protein 6-like n=1 Tax=Trichogramma pretiosum TaxID=7493 RepID=UPI0006C97898|nr:low-density lipoprotein receptor-related protein 6-like [Trichogramma pretiosum]
MSLGAEVDSWDDIEVSKSEDVRDFNQPQTAPSYHRSAKKSYIPQRAYRKYLTNPWIVGVGVALLAAILILIIVLSTVTLGSDGTEPSELRPKPGGTIRDGLYLFGNGSLWNACINETNNNGGEAVLRRVRQAEDTPYDFLDSATTIFGVNNSILSVSSNNDDSAAEVLFQDPRFQPQSVAVDRLTGKVYALDKQAGTLLVVDVASRNFTILMSDLLAPHEIVLDPARGEMFVLQLATSIVRANMDGSARRNIVSYMNISALAIDRGRQRLYWINDDRQIQSADYHGNDRVTLFTDHTRIASLAVHGDRLYWLWPATAGESSNNSTLWRCRLSANDTSACSEHTVQPIPGLSNVTSIRSFSSPPSSTNASSNHPCSVQNGGCQQLCLLSSPSRAGRSCGCYLGHRQKSQDSRGCEPADVFLLYVANSYARAQLAEESFGWAGVDVILPTKLSLRPLQRKSVLDFEYDWFNDALYFSDDSNIYATSLRGWSEQRTLLTVASGYYYEDMAYDWVSGNVYYTEASLSPGNKHRLMMFSERNPRDYRRTVASFNYYDEFGVKGAPYSTLMDSIRGVLYFSAADTSGRDRVRNIYELAENGTRLDGRLTAKYVHEHRILALDQSAGRIYWIWEAERNRATLKWTETREPGVVTRRLDVDVDEPLRSVGVQGDWLYLGTARKISRVNKDTAEDAERLVPRYVERAGLIISGGPYERSSQDIDGFRVIDVSRSFAGQAEFLRDICAESRCQQICYAGDRSQDLQAMTKLTEPSCDCADNLRLSEDGACF